MTKTTGTSKFTINANQFDFVMGMLNQYREPWSAVIREYVSNAVDAVRTVQNPTVQVILPDFSDDTQLVIKDNGVGMSLDFIENNLNSYASSSKRNDNDSIGAKGIGSKSAFSLTDKFTITSVKDGEKTVAIHDRKVGHLTYESEKPVNEPNGTIVTIPIHDIEIANDMNCRISNVINGFNSSVVHVYNNDGSNYEIDWFDSKIDKIKLADNMYITTWDGIHIIQAGVSYQISSDFAYDIILMLKGNTSRYAYNYDVNNPITVLSKSVFRDIFNRLPAGLVITLPANVLELTPSRENIIKNKVNAAVIASVLRNYAEHILEEANKNGYDISIASEVNAYVVNQVDHELNDDSKTSLSWNEAYRFLSRINDAIRIEVMNHNYKYGSFDKLGGHYFSNLYSFNALIPNGNDDGSDMLTSLYAKKKPGTEKSSYDCMEPDSNKMLSNYLAHAKRTGNVLLIENIPSDEYCIRLEEKIIRKRNTYFNETGLKPTDIDYIMLSTGNPIAHLGYWDAKDTMNITERFIQVDYADYKKTMTGYANRMKAARKAKKNSTSTVSNNVTIMGWDRGSAYKYTSVLSNVINRYHNNGCYLIRMDNDEFYKAYADKDYMRALYEKVSIAQYHSFDSGDFLIIRNKGSKALMETITENTITVDDIDYMTNANQMMHDYQKELYGIDMVRVKMKLVNKYRISEYSDMRNIFNVIHSNDYDINSEETRDVFRVLSNVNDGEDYNTFKNLINTSESLSVNIRKLMKYGCVMDEEWRINGCSNEVRNALDYYEKNYPLLKYVLGKINYNETFSNIDNQDCFERVIAYINQCDAIRAKQQ